MQAQASGFLWLDDGRIVWQDRPLVRSVTIPGPHKKPLRQYLKHGHGLEHRTLFAELRAQVEHSLRTVKRYFGYDKVRYRGQHQNRQRLALWLGFHNLLRAAPCLAA